MLKILLFAASPPLPTILNTSSPSQFMAQARPRGEMRPRQGTARSGRRSTLQKKKFTSERREAFPDTDIGLPVTYRPVAAPPAAQPAIVEQDQAGEPLTSTGAGGRRQAAWEDVSPGWIKLRSGQWHDAGGKNWGK